jgi:hypothetical protein
MREPAETLVPPCGRYFFGESTVWKGGIERAAAMESAIRSGVLAQTEVGWAVLF